MVAMLTARARVPALACVGGPAVGRGARRRRDLLRRSATSAPARLLTRLDRLWIRFGHQAVLTTRTRGFEAPPVNSYRVARARALFSRWRFSSEAFLPVF